MNGNVQREVSSKSTKFKPTVGGGVATKSRGFPLEVVVIEKKIEGEKNVMKKKPKAGKCLHIVAHCFWLTKFMTL